MSTRRLAFLGMLVCVGCAATGCGGSDGLSAAGTPTKPAAPSSRTSATAARTAVTPSSTSRSDPPTSERATPSSRPRSCVSTTYARLSAKQRVGQLVMVGLETSTPTSQIDRIMSGDHVGNVFYLGGWQGSAAVARTSQHLDRQATSAATGRVRPLIAADQEGGAVQQLKGTGFTPLPSALEQGRMSSRERVRHATTIGRELKQAGVNVDLAPVAGTVPTSIGRANQPIGRWGREYGHDPGTVSAAVADVVHGLERGGTAATLKHFPGLGRIRDNTDFSSTGITDDVMRANDPYMQPFSAGIKAGASLVMMSLARYPKIDASHPAAFSPKMITGILRGRLEYHGVVISDDLHAVAVRGTPEGQRAVQFISAGGDIALTGATWSAPTIVSAILKRSAQNGGFAQKVDRAAHRVLTLKAQMGLLPCSLVE